MVYIDSAYFGDEKSFRNITQSFLGKISGGTLDVTADEKLIPPFEVSAKTELDNRDQRSIRQDAVAACGGEADQECLERTQLKLSQEKLKEKEQEVDRKNIVKGRRLTVNIIDDNSKRRQIIVPDGQKFTLSGVSSVNPGEKGSAMPARSEIERRVGEVFAMMGYAFVYVFGVVMSYTVFMRESEAYFKIGNTAKGYLFQSVAYGTFLFTLVVAIVGDPQYGWIVGYLTVFLYFAFNAFVAVFTNKANA